MVLHVATRILCSENVQGLFVYAEELLKHFVTTFTILYGMQNVSHNVHGLLHIVEDAKKFGTLDSFSAFRFENFLQTVKRIVRKHEKPLQQIARRYFENCKCVTKVAGGRRRQTLLVPGIKSENHDGPLIENCAGCQYTIVTSDNFLLRANTLADSCCGLDDGSIIIAHNFIRCYRSNKMIVIGKEFCTKRNLYNVPCPSSLMGEFLVDDLSEFKVWDLKKIVKKYVKLPHGTKFFVLPLLHSDHLERQ